MRTLILTRRVNSGEGCFGRLTGEGIGLYSAELPWRDNMRKLSCIPAGAYTCLPYSSARFPRTFRLASVPGRSDILIHSGNFAGNRELGFKSDSSGCILPGTGVGRLNGQYAAKGSRRAMELINTWSGRKGFILEIREDWALEPDKDSRLPESGLQTLL